MFYKLFTLTTLFLPPMALRQWGSHASPVLNSEGTPLPSTLANSPSLNPPILLSKLKRIHLAENCPHNGWKKDQAGLARICSWQGEGKAEHISLSHTHTPAHTPVTLDVSGCPNHISRSCLLCTTIHSSILPHTSLPMHSSATVICSAPEFASHLCSLHKPLPLCP